LRPVEEQGYVIVAVNTEHTDYVDCARRLSLSLKQHDPAARVCVITDQEIADPTFDHVRLLVPDAANPFANDAQIFRLTPFRETIKLEADMLIASSISHYWTGFRNRDVVISTGCRTWQDQVSTARHYRKLFDDNHLPDVYNALTYWRLSSTAQEFFGLVRNIFAHWDQFRTLIKFSPDQPDTDLVYAMAAQIMGPERVTLPGSPTIVHMKRHHAATQTSNWTQELVWETNPLRIQTLAQWGVFHYHEKAWQP
jgi:hypothetical protein